MTGSTRGRGPRIAGAVAGLISAGVALGIAELVAVAGNGRASPVVAVGGSVIDATPRWLKEWAIRSFGTNDKAVLVGVILSVLVGLAALTGMLAVRNTSVGLAGVGVSVCSARCQRRPDRRAACWTPFRRCRVPWRVRAHCSCCCDRSGRHRMPLPSAINSPAARRTTGGPSW